MRFRALSRQAAATSLLDFFCERLHGLLGDFSPFTACQGRIGLVQHREDLEAPAFAFFPERQRFFDRLFFAPKPAVLDSLPNEGALV